MYNVYQDGKKVGQTSGKTHVFKGLQPDTEYTLGVSKVEGDKESPIIEVKGRTPEHEEVVEGETEEEVEEEAGGLSADETEEPLTNGLNDVSAYHIGGGYYELPNGEKVRGKEAAQLKLNEM